VCLDCVMFPHHTPAEMVAKVLKRAGKCTWRPERVVCVGGCFGVAGGGMAGVRLARQGSGGVADCAAGGFTKEFVPPLLLSRV
jgi:hypothetical protein